MEVRFIKLSSDRHLLCVARDDGTVEKLELDTRSFLHHDLAHLAIEAELGLRHAFWGSVARGAPLSGAGLVGADIVTAERLAGPLQTLICAEADPADVAVSLRSLACDVVDEAAAARIAERVRRLVGRWRATPFRDAMTLSWPLPSLATDASAGRGQHRSPGTS